MTKVRGVRGATTAAENTKESILEATKEMLERLIEANSIEADDVASTVFTATQDINAEFPAQAARRLGWDHVALMCAHEMAVKDAPAMCIRALVLINTDKPAKDLKNIYLRGAEHLRSRGMPGPLG